MLKLKLQYFDHLMWRANSLEKTLMLGKIEGRRRRWWQRKRGLDGITDSMDMNLSKLWEMVKDRETGSAAVHWFTKSQTWLSNWTTLLIIDYVKKPPILSQTVNLEENSHSNHFYISSACLLANSLFFKYSKLPPFSFFFLLSPLRLNP